MGCVGHRAGRPLPSARWEWGTGGGTGGGGLRGAENKMRWIWGQSGARGAEAKAAGRVRVVR